MPRLVLLLFFVVAVLYLIIWLFRGLFKKEVDWRGIGFATVYVMAAFYLRHVTEVGGLG